MAELWCDKYTTSVVEGDALQTLPYYIYDLYIHNM